MPLPPVIITLYRLRGSFRCTCHLQLLVSARMPQRRTHCTCLHHTITYDTFALQTLAQHKILSAPVVVAHPGAASAAVPAVEVPAAAGEQHGDILGFIDIKDVLTSFLKASSGLMW